MRGAAVPDIYVSCEARSGGVEWNVIGEDRAMGTGRFEHLTWLLSADGPKSVLSGQNATSMHMRAYCVYGYRQADAGPSTSFNGEWLGGLASGYLLGNGYRLYSPLLMRFVSTDSLSPFEEGGYNAYGYCAGDPVNRVDPTGHRFSWTGILKRLHIIKRTDRQQRQPGLGEEIYRGAEADKAVKKLKALDKDSPIAPLARQNAELQFELAASRFDAVVLREIVTEQRELSVAVLTAMNSPPTTARKIVEADFARITTNIARRLRHTL